MVAGEEEEREMTTITASTAAGREMRRRTTTPLASFLREGDLIPRRGTEEITAMIAAIDTAAEVEEEQRAVDEQLRDCPIWMTITSLREIRDSAA